MKPINLHSFRSIEKGKCINNKLKYDLVLEKEGKVTKYNQVNIDLWGPKTIKT